MKRYVRLVHEDIEPLKKKKRWSSVELLTDIDAVRVSNNQQTLLVQKLKNNGPSNKEIALCLAGKEKDVLNACNFEIPNVKVYGIMQDASNDIENMKTAIVEQKNTQEQNVNMTFQNVTAETQTEKNIKLQEEAATLQETVKNLKEEVERLNRVNENQTQTITTLEQNLDFCVETIRRINNIAARKFE
jgi:alpha-L-fucosidase